jgi:hypothetical protein
MKQRYRRRKNCRPCFLGFFYCSGVHPSFFSWRRRRPTLTPCAWCQVPSGSSPAMGIHHGRLARERKAARARERVCCHREGVQRSRALDVQDFPMRAVWSKPGLLTGREDCANVVESWTWACFKERRGLALPS